MIFWGLDIFLAALAFSVVVKTIRGGGRTRGDDALANVRYSALPQPPEDPRVRRLQAEMDELRAQVERLQESQSFYAQLGAPMSAAPPATAQPPASGLPPAG